MPFYAWKNKKTGATMEVQRPMSEAQVPPDLSGEWERIYSFGLGRVEGGASKGRPSK